jgi:hypothetical protein
VSRPIAEELLFAGLDLSDGALADLKGHTPLWFTSSRRPSSLGTEDLDRLVAVFSPRCSLGLLDGDPLSFLGVDPTWVPTLPAAVAGDFTLADLINFARPNQGGESPTTYGK